MSCSKNYYLEKQLQHYAKEQQEEFPKEVRLAEGNIMQIHREHFNMYRIIVFSSDGKEQIAETTITFDYSL